jgi:hypothetical protein
MTRCTLKPSSQQVTNLLTNSVEGVQVANLESLVRTLASLQFTTKGKIDADGKVEIVFCSPEPIVMEEKVAPTVRFVKPDHPQESTPRRKHRHRERRLLF